MSNNTITLSPFLPYTVIATVASIENVALLIPKIKMLSDVYSEDLPAFVPSLQLYLHAPSLAHMTL